jgi:hypothetical protein
MIRKADKTVTQPFILYVTGQSASGKTTLYGKLKRKYAHHAEIAVHDLDEVGVPRYGRSHWRLYRVDELLANAAARFAEGKSTIICGITMPHEVINSESYRTTLNVHYLMLRMTQAAFASRIRDRLEKSGELKDLASWKRANNHLANNLYQPVVNQKSGIVLDTSKRTGPEVYGEALRIIEGIIERVEK